jgi:hypothetical protein
MSGHIQPDEGPKPSLHLDWNPQLHFFIAEKNIGDKTKYRL